MKVLVLNAGSSSLKYQLLDMEDEKVLCKGLIDRIGLPNSNFIHSIGDEKFKYELRVKNHTEALKYLFNELINKNHPLIDNIKEIDAIGHRVLHTGESFNRSILITKENLKIMESNIDLGPLHMPANLGCIKACQEIVDVPMVAVFDTAFHMTMPEHSYMYGIKYEDYEKYHIRRYGFHGTSHKFVSGEAIKYLGNPVHSKIITCHLGNGSSISAVKDGKCYDTSMGLTPLEGPIMGTRSGNLDPAVVEYLCKKKNMKVEDVIKYLNKQSGFLGVSGISSDVRDLYKAAESGNERARLTIDIFCYMVKKYIGSYSAALGGLDCIVFTGGIGENAFSTRAQILEGLDFMGLILDKNKNKKASFGISEISDENSKVKILIIPTNEELVIARDTRDIVSNITQPIKGYKDKD